MATPPPGAIRIVNQPIWTMAFAAVTLVLAAGAMLRVKVPSNA